MNQLGLRFSTYLLLWLVLGGAFFLDLSFGSVKIPFTEILKIFSGAQPERPSWATIIWVFRLPKAITAALAGAGLAVSGLLMQTLFRNPLADPSILGISSGASLGVALVVLSSATRNTDSKLLQGVGVFGDMGIVVAASLGAAFVLLMLMLIARKVQSVMTLLILGLLFGYAMSAVVSVLIHFSVAERVQAYISWTFGNFGATTWRQMRVFIPVILVGLAMSLAAKKPLNALLLGEAYSRSLGVNIRRARLMIIIITALLSGTITAFCGPIAFLGVAIPHLCRSIFQTSDHRVLLPTVIIVGATVALIADVASQMPGNQVILPLNAVTSLIGAPIIIWFILKNTQVNETFIT